MKVRISGKARMELLEIYRYLAERNEAVADAVLGEIDSKLRQLSEFPFIGRERSEFAPNLRSVLVRTYLMFYTVVEDELVIMRVVDGRMDVDRELRR
jgi:toxin ParE1/3/4